MLKRALIFFTFIIISIFHLAYSQCAMCRAVLESEEGGKKAEAINDGIVYLMALPYLAVGIIFYIIYRMKFAKK
jgi:hypothetical protein